MYRYKYPRPSLTVDCVVFGIGGGELQVLLVERGDEPFVGRWALPGGFVHVSDEGTKGERSADAARRELTEEAGIGVAHMEQLATFDEPNRDPRGRVVSIAYMALVRSSDHALRAGSDAANASWWPAEHLPRLAFDHKEIVKYALARLRAKVRYAPIGFALLSPDFALSELQALYETVLGRAVDKRTSASVSSRWGSWRTRGRRRPAECNGLRRSTGSTRKRTTARQSVDSISKSEGGSHAGRQRHYRDR
jgi:8-oxo-dGTP diphosphatase